MPAQRQRPTAADLALPAHPRFAELAERYPPSGARECVFHGRELDADCVDCAATSGERIPELIALESISPPFYGACSCGWSGPAKWEKNERTWHEAGQDITAHWEQAGHAVGQYRTAITGFAWPTRALVGFLRENGHEQ